MLRLIENWSKIWWRRWSTWLALLYAAVTAAVAWNPGFLLGLLAYFPGNSRAFICGALFVICFGIPVFTALVKQKNLQEITNANQSGNPPATE